MATTEKNVGDAPQTCTERMVYDQGWGPRKVREHHYEVGGTENNSGVPGILGSKRLIVALYCRYCGHAKGNVYPLADMVIDIPGEAGFLASAFHQETPGCMRPDTLEPLSKTAVTPTQSVDSGTRIPLPIRVRRDVDDAEVDAQEVRDVAFRRFLYGTRRQQVPLAVSKNQIGFTLSRCEQFALSFSADKRNLLATIDGPDRDAVLSVVQDSVVKRDTAVRAEHALNLAVQLVGVRDFGDQTDDDLSRQSRLSANLVIRKPMDGVLTKRLSVPSELADSIGGGVGLLQGSKQGFILVRRGKEFEVSDQLHSSHSSTIVPHLKERSGSAWEPSFFLHGLKPRGFQNGRPL